jgi:hypothetical protein
MSLTAILYGTKIKNGQINYFNTLKSELESKNFKVIMTDIFDNLQEYSDSLKESNVVLTENSFAIFDTDNQPKLLDYKNNINQNLNWIETFVQFANNYSDSKPDGNFWRWGQIVQETGSYLCQNCGYIEDFKQGEVFKVCDACQAGEPDGACSPSEGYWEKL